MRPLTGVMLVVVLVLLWVVLGCSGTLHYGEYAKAQAQAYTAQAQARANMVRAYKDIMQRSTNPNAQVIAAVGLILLANRPMDFALQVPKDGVKEVLGVAMPFLGIWGVAATMGHYMSKMNNSTTTTTNNYDASVSGQQNSITITPGNENVSRYSSTWTNTKTDNHTRSGH